MWPPPPTWWANCRLGDAAAAAAAGKPVPAGVRGRSDRCASRGARRVVPWNPACDILGTLAQRHPAYAQLKALSIALGRTHRRQRGIDHRGRERRGRVSRRCGAAPGAGRGAGRQSRVVRGRHGGLPAQGLCAVGRHRSGARIWPMRIAGRRGSHHCRDHAFTGVPERVGMWCCPWAPLPRPRHVREPRRALAELGGAGKAVGESRPGWKMLRVLANLLNIHGVDYDSSDEVRDALKALCGSAGRAGAYALRGLRCSTGNSRPAVGGRAAVPRRCAGARLRGAGQNQGRALARACSRACGIGAPFASGFGR